MMTQYQKLNFHSIEDFLDYLPEEELRMVNVLRDFILENLPQVTEKLAYNVPFYYGHYRICYIWPASVPWGGVKSGVSLGFCNGYLMDNGAYLERKNNKQIATINFKRQDEIDLSLIGDFLHQAMQIDSDLYHSKRERAKI